VNDTLVAGLALAGVGVAMLAANGGDAAPRAAGARAEGGPVGDLSSATPVEVDTAIAAIHRLADGPSREMADTRRSINRYTKAGWKVPEYLPEKLARATLPRLDAHWRRRPLLTAER